MQWGPALLRPSLYVSPLFYQQSNQLPGALRVEGRVMQRRHAICLDTTVDISLQEKWRASSNPAAFGTCYNPYIPWPEAVLSQHQGAYAKLPDAELSCRTLKVGSPWPQLQEGPRRIVTVKRPYNPGAYNQCQFASQSNPHQT